MPGEFCLSPFVPPFSGVCVTMGKLNIFRYDLMLSWVKLNKRTLKIIQCISSLYADMYISACMKSCMSLGEHEKKCYDNCKCIAECQKDGGSIVSCSGKCPFDKNIKGKYKLISSINCRA